MWNQAAFPPACESVVHAFPLSTMDSHSVVHGSLMLFELQQLPTQNKLLPQRVGVSSHNDKQITRTQPQEVSESGCN